MEKVECPICYEMIDKVIIEQHADSCVESMNAKHPIKSSSTSKSTRISFDSDIFDDEVGHDHDSSKRKSWNLENSFEKSEANPSKRKRLSQIGTNSGQCISNESLHLAPYPEAKNKNIRGCLKDQGNNPGPTVQTLLMKKQQDPKMCSYTHSENVPVTGNSRGFKLHPFLAKKESPVISVNEDPGCSALIPDGEGGFTVNTMNFDEDSGSDSELLPMRSSLSNGFIDFKNQFKENSSSSKSQTSKPKKSPKKKKKWKPFGVWRGKGRRGRGGNRSRRGG